MKLYLYAKSGHSIGLDATRRCAAISSKLKAFDPILCTCDFRAGAYAKEELGIKKYVSVDVLSNLPNLMERNDILIYESDEASEFMQHHMKEFCSLIYKLDKDIPLNIVNDELFNPNNKTEKIEKAFFFGDDDYNNLLLQLCENSSQHDIPLLWGHYFFLGNERKFSAYFSSILEEEEYIKTINNTQYLLSSSINACLESVACGNQPVFYKRQDKTYCEIDLLNKLQIPIITGTTLDEIFANFEAIIKNYPAIENFHNYSLDSIVEEVTQKFHL